jgi:hypothetical protein
MAVASRSAVMVPLVRARLTWTGVDDPFARQMPPPSTDAPANLASS